MNSNINPDLGGARPLKKAKVQVTSTALWMYRMWVVLRFATAIFGGYALAVLSTLIITRVFIDAPMNAVMTATLWSFCIHVAAFIWVFMLQSHIKACLGIVVPLVALYVVYLALGA